MTTSANTSGLTVVTNEQGHKKQILVLQARWVLMGYVTKKDDGTLRISEGHVIRVWGTTYGLGQIALEGPTKETILDPFGDGEVPAVSLLFSIDCYK